MCSKLLKYNFYFFMLLFFGLFVYFLGFYFLYFDYLFLVDWEIISFNSSSVVMTLLFDWMSLLFMGSVLLISCMVILYSGSYMLGDDYKLRFLLLVILFVVSMCFMIVSPNLISILLGWDGLGLVSYCLVVYFHNVKSYGAGMITILVNRVGDVAILLGISILFNSGGWYFMYYNYYIYDWSYLLVLIIVLAAFTKSAQIPFSSWLPAAMAAPTPVSALVHSSTLVTAGVYLLIRFSVLLSHFNVSFFLVLSVMTMFMSGLCAVYEFDMKKIIALSTLSQLGLMMTVLFMGYSVVSFFHLLTHAFFSALLFLCAGLFIHCMNDTQDIRFMGGLVNMIPYTSTCFGVSNLSLCGLPFLSGFYSKDLSIELMSVDYFNLFIYFIFYISLGLTAFYSIRLVYYCMVGFVNLSSCNSFLEDNCMMYSMLFLVFMAVISGSMLSWLIFPFPSLIVIPLEASVFSLFCIILGLFCGYEFCLMNYYFSYCNSFILDFFGSMWFMPYFSTYFFYSSGYFLSLNYVKFLDWGWGEYLMSILMSLYFLMLGSLNLYFQYNNIKIFYSLFVIFALLLLI
uniref:NADH-ubiquinone oxidoreductase chain 5 n=1 Tax=Chauliops fallax TaxID=1244200 RepID=M4HZ13_9HEMI|nr:NADH dehydrogenase subunit 5 [Chauliops fallax]AFV25572.1 NADH dehydrogenase subunit 5 [Chauliops fallax]